MKKFLKLFFDKSLLIFICVGLANTVVSLAIMFLLYNICHFGYWGSSAVAYVLASIMSFVLNKNLTFSHKGSVLKSAVRFSIVIAVCYLIAFKAAQPLTMFLLAKFFKGFARTGTKKMVEQITMLVGMVIFTALNYLGQRFFAFRGKPAV